MARTIEIDIAHALGTEKAMRRIRRRAERLQEKNAAHLQSVEAEWGPSTGVFSIRALGQTIPARVAVTDTRARLAVSLPLLATPFSGPIEAYLRKEAAKALAEPA